jgi:hypothetical protein
MRKTIFILLILCVLQSCRSHKDDEATKVIELDTSTKSFDSMDVIADSVSFIPLETNSSAFLGMEFQIVFTDERIMVCDYGGQRILFFDLGGRYIEQISRRGRGPGEYLSMSKVMVDLVNNQIIVYDVLSQKVIYYDREMKFVREIDDFSNNAIIRDIINLPDGGFLCYAFDRSVEEVGVEGSGLWRVDSNGEFQESYFIQEEIYKWGYSSSQYSNFQRVSDEVISLKDPHTNDIYHYYCDEKRLEKYAVYQQSSTISDVAKQSGKSEDLDDNYFTSSYAQESEKYIYTSWYSRKNGQFFTLYDKGNGSMIYLKSPFDFSNSHLSAIKGMVLNSNRKDVIVTAIFGSTILDCLVDPATPQHTKETLQGLIVGKKVMVQKVALFRIEK